MPEISDFSPLGRRRLALDIAFRRHPYDDDRAMRLAPQLVDFLFQEIGGSVFVDPRMEHTTESTILPADMADSLTEGGFQEALGFDALEVSPDVADAMPQAGPETGEAGALIQQEGGEHGGAEALVEPPVDGRTEEAGAPEKAPCTETDRTEIQNAGGAADEVPPATGAMEGLAEPTFLVPTGMAARVLVLLANRQRQGEAMPGNGEIDRTLKLTKNGAAYAINYLTGKGLLHKKGQGRDRVLTVTPAGLATVDALSRTDTDPGDTPKEEEAGEDEAEAGPTAEAQPVATLPESADPIGAVQPFVTTQLSELPQLTDQPLKLLATIRRMSFAGVCTATNASLAAASGCARGAAGRAVVVLRDAGVIDVRADSTRGRMIRITEKGRAVLARLNAEETDLESAAGKAGGDDSGGDRGGPDADEPEEDAGPASAPSGGESRRAYARGSDALGAALARSGMRFEDEPRARLPEKVMCAIPTREVGGGSGLADVVG